MHHSFARRASLMVFKVLLYLSSPNFPSRFAVVVFLINQIKVELADHYEITKMDSE